MGDSSSSGDEGRDGSIGQSKMEDAARARKRRLMAMKSRIHGVEMSDEDYETVEQPRDKNAYEPTTGDLGVVRVNDSKQLFAVEKEIGEHLAATLETEVVEKVDLSTLAPRKVDWDLKRDVAPRLERLERRTQKAIAQLIRQRLANEGGKPELLVSAVNSAIRSDLQEEDEGDD